MSLFGKKQRKSKIVVVAHMQGKIPCIQISQVTLLESLVSCQDANYSNFILTLLPTRENNFDI